LCCELAAAASGSWFNIRSYAVCGVNELGIQLAKNIEGAPEMGLRLAGFL